MPDDPPAAPDAADDDPRRPLRGVRVVDMTRLLPGNFCTWLLSSLGADVVKVEDTGAGDYMRTFGTQIDGSGAANHLVNRGKRSVALNLKDERARWAFLSLVDTADVMVESFRPGVLDRLGVGVGVLLRRRPSLVVASLSGFGQTGPLRDTAAHDLNYLAVGGLLERLGPKDGPPVVPPLPLADLVGGGLVPAVGILSLVLQARRTGRGAWLDASMTEGVALLPTMVVAEVLAGASPPGRGRDEFTGGAAYYGVYELADGYVAIGAVEPPFWNAVCDALGRPDLVESQHSPDQGALRAAIAESCRAMTRAEAERLFQGVDACVSVVRSYEEALESELATARGFVRREPGVPMPVLAPPFVVDGARPPPGGPAPRQGEHTRDVLRGAGVSEAEVDELLRHGNARQAAAAPPPGSEA